MMNYVNTRIAAMRADLMTRESVEELLEANDARAFSDRLLNSPYGESFAEALTGASQRDALNKALLRNMTACFTRIRRFTPVELKTTIDALLEFMDVQAMKSIIRGLHSKLPPTIIRSAAGVGNRLTEAQVTTLSEEADIPTAIAHLATWGHPYGAVLHPHLDAYRLDDDPTVFEVALDLFRYDVPKSHAAADLIAIEAEIRNVVNALTCLGDDRKAPMLNQGNRSPKLVTALRQAHSHNEAIALLAESPFRDVLDKALPMLLIDQTRTSLLERVMDEILIREVGRVALLDPDSPAVAYQYVLLKRNEVMNLRLIGIGLLDGLQRNAIRSSLIFKEAA